MSADVHDLTGDMTMNANTNVRLANDDVWSMRSTGGTSALIADNGASEIAYRRPYAPRSAKPKTLSLTGYLRIHVRPFLGERSFPTFAPWMFNR